MNFFTYSGVASLDFILIFFFFQVQDKKIYMQDAAVEKNFQC